MKNREIIITDQESGSRLDRIIRKYGITQAIIEKSLRKGLIKLNHHNAKANDRLNEGDIITINPSITTVSSTVIRKTSINPVLISKIKTSIIYKDEDLIVINKPNNLAVQGGSKIKISLDDMLDHFCFDLATRPKLVHRIDKETTGLLLLARHNKAAILLTEYFRNKQIEKSYLAVIIGVPSLKTGKIISNIDEIEATTYYKVLGSIKDEYSIVLLTPITGKKHQLRIHCKLLGHPILGDQKYGIKSKHPLHLHAYKLLLKNFMNKARLEFKAIPPMYIKTMCQLAGINI